MKNGLVAVVVCTAVFVGCVFGQQGSVVELKKTNQGYHLTFNGEPYFVRGAGGQSHLEILKESGGNSFRTWGADGAKEHLDRAHALGLTVTLGIWLGHERHGFDYTNQEQLDAQRAMVERVVLEFKDHPALLMWGLGNEVALTGDPNKFFPEIGRLAAMVKELDPHHPTMTVLAGASEEKIAAFMKHCPSIDVLGVNSYGTAAGVPEALDRAGYTGPYMLTEYGPRGWWESPTTSWGAQIEPTDAQKMETYQKAYELAVASRPEQCLGSYVFLWGQKQEATSTWFSMFFPDGTKTPTVDVMHRMWTGTEPANRSPVVSGIESEVAMAEVAPDVVFEASVDVHDADDDALRVVWLVVGESTDRKMGGDAEAVPGGRPELTLESEISGAKLRTPSEPGAYRLFVKVYDDKGAAGSANVPFLVTARE